MTQIREPFSVVVLNEYVTLHSSNDTNYRIMLIEMGLFLGGRERQPDCVCVCVRWVSYIGNCNRIFIQTHQKKRLTQRAIILIHSLQARARK